MYHHDKHKFLRIHQLRAELRNRGDGDETGRRDMITDRGWLQQVDSKFCNYLLLLPSNRILTTFAVKHCVRKSKTKRLYCARFPIFFILRHGQWFWTKVFIASVLKLLDVLPGFLLFSLWCGTFFWKQHLRHYWHLNRKMERPTKPLPNPPANVMGKNDKRNLYAFKTARNFVVVTEMHEWLCTTSPSS